MRFIWIEYINKRILIKTNTKIVLYFIDSNKKIQDKTNFAREWSERLLQIWKRHVQRNFFRVITYDSHVRVPFVLQYRFTKKKMISKSYKHIYLVPLSSINDVRFRESGGRYNTFQYFEIQYKLIDFLKLYLNVLIYISSRIIYWVIIKNVEIHLYSIHPVCMFMCACGISKGADFEPPARRPTELYRRPTWTRKTTTTGGSLDVILL